MVGGRSAFRSGLICLLITSVLFINFNMALANPAGDKKTGDCPEHLHELGAQAAAYTKEGLKAYPFVLRRLLNLRFKKLVSDIESVILTYCSDEPCSEQELMDLVNSELMITASKTQRFVEVSRKVGMNVFVASLLIGGANIALERVFPTIATPMAYFLGVVTSPFVGSIMAVFVEQVGGLLRKAGFKGAANRLDGVKDRSREIFFDLYWAQSARITGPESAGRGIYAAMTFLVDHHFNPAISMLEKADEFEAQYRIHQNEEYKALAVARRELAIHFIALAAQRIRKVYWETTEVNEEFLKDCRETLRGTLLQFYRNDVEKVELLKRNVLSHLKLIDKTIEPTYAKDQKVRLFYDDLLEAWLGQAEIQKETESPIQERLKNNSKSLSQMGTVIDLKETSRAKKPVKSKAKTQNEITLGKVYEARARSPY